MGRPQCDEHGHRAPAVFTTAWSQRSGRSGRALYVLYRCGVCEAQWWRQVEQGSDPKARDQDA